MSSEKCTWVIRCRFRRADRLAVQVDTSDVALDVEKRSYDRDEVLEQSVALAAGSVDEKKLMRKIDLRVVPVLCVLYLLAFLDRYVPRTCHPVLGSDNQS